MSPFNSILLPLDGSPEAARAIGCSVWLAARLGATLHVLHSGSQPLVPNETMARLGAAEARRAQVVLHQTAMAPERALLDAIEQHRVSLVVMSARGQSASSGIDPDRRMGRVALALLERSSVPILLIPVRYRESLPWRSILVASSGEAAADQALRWAVRFSHALDLRATVAYVEEADAAARERLVRYSDAPHHEYPERLEEMVRRAVACCSAEECRCISEVLIRRGDPATELLGQVEQLGSSVLAVGWHGKLGGTSAPVLRRLLERAECPLLVVRQRAGSRARLKIGDEIGGARPA